MHDHVVYVGGGRILQTAQQIVHHPLEGCRHHYVFCLSDRNGTYDYSILGTLYIQFHDQWWFSFNEIQCIQIIWLAHGHHKLLWFQLRRFLCQFVRVQASFGSVLGRSGNLSTQPEHVTWVAIATSPWCLKMEGILRKETIT